MKVTTFAVDLAKYKFQVHGFDARAEKRLAKTLKRSEFLAFFGDRAERCEVVMEACGGAHHWARELERLGYRVRLIAPQFVKPFVMGNKNDANDADAIFEASERPKVRAVAVKSIAQQDALLVHATREQWIKWRTALVNQIRGELAERGIVFGKQIGVLRKALVGLLAAPLAGEMTGLFRDWLSQRLQDWHQIDERIAGCDDQIQQHVRTDPACGQILEVCGIGPITASATLAAIGHARPFRSSRHLASWMGLTPKEHSSGERRHLGTLTKRGDGYLRKLFVHGGRSAVRMVGAKIKAGKLLNDRERWIHALVTRRGFNKACVAVAAKNARIVWALLTSGQDYRVPV